MELEKSVDLLNLVGEGDMWEYAYFVLKPEMKQLSM